MATPRPVLNAFLVCERVIRDETSRRVTVVSILDRITAQRFPHQHPISAYVRMTEAHQVQQVTVELFSLSDMSASSVLEEQYLVGTERLDEVTGVFTLLINNEPVTFPRAGDYEFRLSVHGHPLGSHRVRVG